MNDNLDPGPVNDPPPITEQIYLHPSSKMKWFKLLILIFVLILIPVIILLAWKYASHNNNQDITKVLPVATPTPNPTQSWKTYTSRLGFTFLYPPSYFIDEPTDSNDNRLSIIAINDKTRSPVFTIYTKGFVAHVRKKEDSTDTEVKDTSDIKFDDYVRKTVLANYDATGPDTIVYAYSINDQVPYKNIFGLTGFKVYPVLRTIKQGVTSYQVVGPLYVVDISAYSNQRALYAEPNYAQTSVLNNKTELDPIFKNILDSIAFITHPDPVAGWKTFSGSNYTIKYPPDWSIYQFPVLDANGGVCVDLSDLKNPQDVPVKIDSNGHKIITACSYQGDMPTSFPYTNGIGGNNTISEYSVNGFSGIRGQSTSAIGIVDNVFLKKPNGGYIVLQNQIGDSTTFNNALSTFEFTQ